MDLIVGEFQINFPNFTWDPKIHDLGLQNLIFHLTNKNYSNHWSAHWRLKECLLQPFAGQHSRFHQMGLGDAVYFEKDKTVVGCCLAMFMMRDDNVNCEGQRLFAFEI